MDFRKYFSQAQNEANENFFNYDGYDDYDSDDFDGDDFDDYDSDDFDGDDFDDYDGDDYGNASGSRRQQTPTSQPYIVVITNTNTATNSTPVTILGAYTNIGSTAPSFNNFSAISIGMGISGLTYTEFLYQSMNKSFMVGLTYLQSASANQVLETITILTKDINGNQAEKVLIPTIDPYQQQNSIIALKFAYKIDGFTSLIISSVLAGITTKIYFYPSETISDSRALSGRKPLANYGNPNVVKGDTLKLSPSTARALMGGRGGRNNPRRRR
jgi:hypothetical protein